MNIGILAFLFAAVSAPAYLLGGSGAAEKQIDMRPVQYNGEYGIKEI